MLLWKHCFFFFFQITVCCIQKVIYIQIGTQIPHIQYTTTLKVYIRERHASKLCLMEHLHDKAQIRVCLHEGAHRFHVADLASYHIEVYAEMVIMAVAVLAASESIGLSIKILELVVTWDYWFDRYMCDLDKGERNLGMELLSMTKTTESGDIGICTEATCCVASAGGCVNQRRCRHWWN